MYAFRVCLLAFCSLTATVGELGAQPVDAAEVRAERGLAVIVAGLRNDSGQLLVGVHEDPEAFPSRPEFAVRSATVRISHRSGRADFPDLPDGVYAVAVCHDENDNGRCDANFLGVPSEGVAASRGAVGRFGPPAFDDAKFSHRSNELSEVEVVVSY